MMILHNFGNHILPSETYSGGDSEVYAANGHSAFPGVPEVLAIDQIISPSSYSTDGRFDMPPSGLVACALARTWMISASISAGGASLTVVDQEISLEDAFSNPITTIGERIAENGASAGIRLDEFSEMGDSSIVLTIVAGRLSSVRFSPTERKWSWPLAISVSYTNYSDSGPPFGIATVSRGGFGAYSPDFPELGMQVDFFGEDVVLYGADDDDLNEISGSITIAASSYLRPITAP